MARNVFNIPGGFEAQYERLVELAAGVSPHVPAHFPQPSAAHYAALAARKRREADSILRHVRRDDVSEHARFARRQAQELRDQADEYERLATGRD